MEYVLDTSAVFLPPIIFVLPAKLFITTVKTKNTMLAYLRAIEVVVETTINPLIELSMFFIYKIIDGSEYGLIYSSR